MLNYRWLGPTPRISKSVGLVWDPGFAFLTYSQVMLVLLDHRIHISNYWSQGWMKGSGIPVTAPTLDHEGETNLIVLNP